MIAKNQWIDTENAAAHALTRTQTLNQRSWNLTEASATIVSPAGCSIAKAIHAMAMFHLIFSASDNHLRICIGIYIRFFRRKKKREKTCFWSKRSNNVLASSIFWWFIAALFRGKNIDWLYKKKARDTRKNYGQQSYIILLHLGVHLTPATNRQIIKWMMHVVFVLEIKNR